MNVLVVAPHPDDEAIGCGGALCCHVRKGDRVIVAFLTSGEIAMKHLPREEAWRIREAEAETAARAMSVMRLAFLRCPDWYLQGHVSETARLLKPVIAEEAPQLIYLPHSAEWHPDHQAAEPITRLALPPAGDSLPLLLGYEVWTPLQAFDHVTDITESMACKLRAVRCYRSQIASFRYDRAISGLNRYRGEMAAKCRYAEVFASLPDHTDLS